MANQLINHQSIIANRKYFAFLLLVCFVFFIPDNSFSQSTSSASSLSGTNFVDDELKDDDKNNEVVENLDDRDVDDLLNLPDDDFQKLVDDEVDDEVEDVCPEGYKLVRGFHELKETIMNDYGINIIKQGANDSIRLIKPSSTYDNYLMIEDLGISQSKGNIDSYDFYFCVKECRKDGSLCSGESDGPTIECCGMTCNQFASADIDNKNSKKFVCGVTSLNQRKDFLKSHGKDIIFIPVYDSCNQVRKKTSCGLRKHCMSEDKDHPFSITYGVLDCPKCDDITKELECGKAPRIVCVDNNGEFFNGSLILSEERGILGRKGCKKCSELKATNRCDECGICVNEDNSVGSECGNNPNNCVTCKEKEKVSQCGDEIICSENGKITRKEVKENCPYCEDEVTIRGCGEKFWCLGSEDGKVRREEGHNCPRCSSVDKSSIQCGTEVKCMRMGTDITSVFGESGCDLCSNVIKETDCGVDVYCYTEHENQKKYEFARGERNCKPCDILDESLIECDKKVYCKEDDLFMVKIGTKNCCNDVKQNSKCGEIIMCQGSGGKIIEERSTNNCPPCQELSCGRMWCLSGDKLIEKEVIDGCVRCLLVRNKCGMIWCLDDRIDSDSEGDLVEIEFLRDCELCNIAKQRVTCGKTWCLNKDNKGIDDDYENHNYYDLTSYRFERRRGTLEEIEVTDGCKPCSEVVLETPCGQDVSCLDENNNMVTRKGTQNCCDKLVKDTPCGKIVDCFDNDGIRRSMSGTMDCCADLEKTTICGKRISCYNKIGFKESLYGKKDCCNDVKEITKCGVLATCYQSGKKAAIRGIQGCPECKKKQAEVCRGVEFECKSTAGVYGHARGTKKCS